MSVFSERLVQLRKSREMSQIALAKEIGVSSRIYQEYEYGKSEPKMSNLVSIADFFGVSIDYLSGRTDTP
ncbi:MAG: helix-turn-helix domain-containing protein [Lawsonibacter sp.]|nr:helix-turn-helix transcriptional regulator [Lawsonibacter sp.]MCI9027010.1 helix-turn-helix transcriptional regulator [Lawsonibacter sp.]MCI9294777.1 helix-turn-helix transcriptional regulator [Lawsonibacter sp.]MCI9655360.1 helix-turn-helix transcriptional regulator [Lawsonibacter sp.]MDE6898600.1 helix-turn-helix domain-containing protein [Lawsonibacter sp.]